MEDVCQRRSSACFHAQDEKTKKHNFVKLRWSLTWKRESLNKDLSIDIHIKLGLTNEFLFNSI